MRLFAVSCGVDPQPGHPPSCVRTIRPHVSHFIGAKAGVLTRSAPMRCSKQHTIRPDRIVVDIGYEPEPPGSLRRRSLRLTRRRSGTPERRSIDCGSWLPEAVQTCRQARHWKASEWLIMLVNASQRTCAADWQSGQTGIGGGTRA